jgi:hypothetical protein
MRGKREAAGVAVVIACLAAATPARALEAPGAPQIYDAAGRVVGIAMSADPVFGRGRVLLNFGADQAVLHINRLGFLVGGPDPAANAAAPAGYRDGVYFASRDCRGEAYLPVSSFPDYGLFIADGAPGAGRTQAGTVVYAARPYAIIVLRGKKTDDGACDALARPVESLVGYAKQTRLPAFQLPFVTK